MLPRRRCHINSPYRGPRCCPQSNNDAQDHRPNSPPPTLEAAVAQSSGHGRLTTNCARRGHVPCHIAGDHPRPGTVRWPHCLVRTMAFESPRLPSRAPQRLHSKPGYWHSGEASAKDDIATHGIFRGTDFCGSAYLAFIRSGESACIAAAAPDGAIRWHHRRLQTATEIFVLRDVAAALESRQLLRWVCGDWSPCQVPAVDCSACFRCHGWNDMIECRTISRAGSVAGMHNKSGWTLCPGDQTSMTQPVVI